MHRREALRLLATATAFQLAPGNFLRVLREARSLLATGESPRTLTLHQNATVKAMAELILPRTGTPGATDVGVGEFIDLMLTEWYDEPDRAHFLNGLSEVDERANALFGKSFAESSADQQANILTWLGERMKADTNATTTAGRQRRGSSRTSRGDFYLMLRHLTLTAYYTSEAGATEALHFQIIPDSHDACAEIPDAEGDAHNQ